MAPPRSGLRPPPPLGGNTSGPAEPDPRCSLGSELPPARVGVAPEAFQWHAADGEHIDVRRLEAPRPLVAILQLVDRLGDTGVVVVHHDREPLLLYPELAERGWAAEPLAAPAGEVRLRLTCERKPR